MLKKCPSNSEFLSLTLSRMGWLGLSPLNAGSGVAAILNSESFIDVPSMGQGTSRCRVFFLRSKRCPPGSQLSFSFRSAKVLVCIRCLYPYRVMLWMAPKSSHTPLAGSLPDPPGDTWWRVLSPAHGSIWCPHTGSSTVTGDPTGDRLPPRERWVGQISSLASLAKVLEPNMTKKLHMQMTHAHPSLPTQCMNTFDMRLPFKKGYY